ncbi:MAG: Lipoprotein NlpI precursor [Verrucomicrobiota bacterium]
MRPPRPSRILPSLLLAVLTPLASAQTEPHADWLAREKALTEALIQTPNSLSLLSRRGDFRQFLGQPEQAVADYERMIQIDPAQDAPHWRLGIAYYFAGAFSKAALQFQKYHAYDGRDRENGLWKFFSQARAEGLDAARRDMLLYKEFDREPFPSLYAMCAGKMPPDEVLKEVETKGLQNQRQVVFFAKYYVGLYLCLLDQKSEGLALVKEAVRLFSPSEAAVDGPGYMWQVARLHAEALGREIQNPQKR